VKQPSSVPPTKSSKAGSSRRPFDVATNEPAGMPCEVPLKTYPVAIVDGKVRIEV
jgi:hypothetical protein